MTNDIIEDITVSGEDVVKVVKEIEKVIKNTPLVHAYIACLSIAVSMMKKGISVNEMRAAVKGMSEWLCLFLAEDDLKKSTRLN